MDEKTWNAYIDLKINRKVALDLLKVDDIDLRHQYLDAACKEANERYKKEVKVVEAKLALAEEKEEIAEAQLALAESQGDEEMVKAAKENLEEVKSKAESKRKEKEKKKPQAKTKDLVKGSQSLVEKSQDEVVPQNPLRPGKIKKIKLLLQEICDNDGMYDGEKIADKSNLLAAIACLDAVLEGNQNIISVMKSVCTTKVALASSLGSNWNNDKEIDGEQEEEDDDDFGFGSYSEEDEKSLLESDDDFSDLPEN